MNVFVIFMGRYLLPGSKKRLSYFTRDYRVYNGHVLIVLASMRNKDKNRVLKIACNSETLLQNACIGHLSEYCGVRFTVR